MTPTAGYELLQALMAAAMFEATVAVLPLPKVPVVALVQPLVVWLSVSELAGLPNVVLVIVTTLPIAFAVTPTAEYAVLQALMAFARLVAEVDG